MQESRKLEEPEGKEIVKQDLYCYFAPGSHRWMETSLGYTSQIRNICPSGKLARNTAAVLR
jgi:hypothetical protein